MVGFILACLGHRYRAVAGSNPALPTMCLIFESVVFFLFMVMGDKFLILDVQNNERNVQKNERLPFGFCFRKRFEQ